MQPCQDSRLRQSLHLPSPTQGPSVSRALASEGSPPSHSGGASDFLAGYLLRPLEVRELLAFLLQILRLYHWDLRKNRGYLEMFVIF